MTEVNRSAYDEQVHDGLVIGDRVKKLREAKRMSQGKLAQLTGIAQASLSLIESGKTRKLKGDTLMRLAKALEADPEYIRTGRRQAHKFDVALVDADVLNLSAKLTPPNRETWLAMGQVLAQGQARGLHKTAPSAAPAATTTPNPQQGDIVLAIVAQFRQILDEHGPDVLSRAFDHLEGAASQAASEDRTRKPRPTKR